MKNINRIMLLALALVICAFALSSCDIDWNYCQHTLEEIEKTEASCMKVGKKTAYECTKCGKLFAYGYLNGKDGAKDLYEIENQEMLGYAGHKIGDFYGDIKEDLPTFDPSSLEDICSVMGQTPAWANGLLLRADGYVCDFYKKD